MDINELFIEGYKIPEPLTKQEVYELVTKIKKGDKKAKNKLIEHNIRLVLHEVIGKFKNVAYDKKELVSIGNIGLMKAISSFDETKKVEFSTYATRCIDNEILMFLRKLKKHENVHSLNEVIYSNKEGIELTIEDTIYDDTDIVEEYTKNETYCTIRKIIKDLPECDREIIMLYFGFYNDKIHTQQEIAKILSVSQAHISRSIPKIVDRLRKQLQQTNLVELKNEQATQDKSKLKNVEEDKDLITLKYKRFR